MQQLYGSFLTTKKWPTFHFLLPFVDETVMNNNAGFLHLQEVDSLCQLQIVINMEMLDEYKKNDDKIDECGHVHV